MIYAKLMNLLRNRICLNDLSRKNCYLLEQSGGTFSPRVLGYTTDIVFILVPNIYVLAYRAGALPGNWLSCEWRDS